MSQLILITSLFTLLIGWLIIFAYLALRPIPEKHVEQTEHMATQIPITPPVIQTLTITPRAPGMRTIAQQTPIVTISADSTREIILDRSRHSYNKK
jgi:hypothetical protein